MTIETWVGIGIAALVVFGIVFVRNFMQDGRVSRWLLAVPNVVEAVATFVREADRIYEQLKIDYADAAEEQGLDVRLLWVIDQVENYVKVQFGLTVDINWLIATIEGLVRDNKLPVIEIKTQITQE